MPASILVFSARAPHGSGLPQEALDAVLMASAFVQTRLVFIRDGVYQVLRDQDPTLLGTKDVAAGFGALPHYGVHELLVCRSSLQARGIDESLLLEGLTPVSAEDIRVLLGQPDQQVLTF